MIKEKTSRGGKRKHPYPNRQTVFELFVYFDSGENYGLCWRKKRGSRSGWTKAGCKFSSRVQKEPDRLMVKLNGVMFNVRDLTWIYHYGDLPKGGLKLEDGDCWNLRIQNIVPRKPVVSFM